MVLQSLLLYLYLEGYYGNRTAVLIVAACLVAVVWMVMPYAQSEVNDIQRRLMQPPGGRSLQHANLSGGDDDDDACVAGRAVTADGECAVCLDRRVATRLEVRARVTLRTVAPRIVFVRRCIHH